MEEEKKEEVMEKTEMQEQELQEQTTEKEETIEEKLKKVMEERDKYYSNWLRAEAELDNYKKRMAKEKEEFRKFAIENFVREILTPIDYLEMAIAHAKTSQNVEALIQGVEYTHKCLLDILKSYDITPLSSEGEPFDPAVHEAQEVVETEDVKEGTVLKEHRKAYKMCGRLLRAAIVSVAKAPEKQEGLSENEIKEDKEE
ncbi:MAG: hypothetical protein OHK0040_05220 [bacterium]